MPFPRPFHLGSMVSLAIQRHSDSLPALNCSGFKPKQYLNDQIFDPLSVDHFFGRLKFPIWACIFVFYFDFIHLEI
jgi:hypothetical protein